MRSSIQAELRLSDLAFLAQGERMFGWARFGGLCGAALALFLTGCGTSQYNALMGRRLTALRGAVKFQGLYAPTRLGDTPFSIRVPLEFEHSYEATSAHDDDGAVINPERLQPPFLKLPGFKLCYEGTTQSGNDTLPYYCYLAAEPIQPGGADKLLAQLQAQLKAAFPPPKPEAEGKGDVEAALEWRPLDADTPEGLNIHWRKIRVEGEQPFMVKTGDKVAPQKLPGIFELWAHDAGEYVVLVGWRAPKSIDAPSETKYVDPFNRPSNLKPDLREDGMPFKTAGTLTRSAAEAAPTE
jgi:hypothetical protein